MEKCPVCNTKTNDKKQQYCTKCKWEIEWYLGDLNQEAKEQYTQRLKRYKEMYLQSINGGGIKEPLELDDEPPKNYFGLRYLFLLIYFLVKYFIKILSWGILWGIIAIFFAFIFDKSNIAFKPFTDDETGLIVGSIIFLLMAGIYFYKKFSK
jgi:hypothetical protein